MSSAHGASYLERMAKLTGEGPKSSRKKAPRPAAAMADARTELSDEALEALAGFPDRMSSAVFNELTSKGYLVQEKRTFQYSAKAEAYRAALGKRK